MGGDVRHWVEGAYRGETWKHAARELWGQLCCKWKLLRGTQNFSFRLQMGTITHSKALFDLSDRYFNNYVRLILMQSRVRLPDKPLYRTGTLTVRTVKSRVTEAIECTFSFRNNLATPVQGPMTEE